MFFFLFVCIYLIHAFIILLLGCRINFLPDLLTYEFSPPSAPTRTSRPGALLSCRETVCGFTWPSGWTSSIFFCHLVLHSLATGFFFFPLRVLSTISQFWPLVLFLVCSFFNWPLIQIVYWAFAYTLLALLLNVCPSPNINHSPTLRLLCLSSDSVLTSCPPHIPGGCWPLPFSEYHKAPYPSDNR